mgnify:FL=1
MKTFSNKKTEITDGKKEFTYKDLIIFCINSIPEKGFDREEMKKRERIEKALEVKGDFKFEDADAHNLKEVVKSVRWNFRHKELSEFLDAINYL